MEDTTILISIIIGLFVSCGLTIVLLSVQIKLLHEIIELLSDEDDGDDGGDEPIEVPDDPSGIELLPHHNLT